MAPSGKWIDGIGRETSVEEAARRSLEARLTTVAHFLPLAAHLAEHDVEHVHRLRVATRRAAAALKLYRECLPSKKSRWVKKQLRKMRRAASEARDLDVLIQRLQSQPGAAAHAFVQWLKEKRSAVQPGIIELAGNLRREDRFVRKAARLVHKIAPPENGDQCTKSTCFGDWAPRQLAKLATEFFDAWPDTAGDIDLLHRFRIRAKAIRYAVELLAPAFERRLRDETYPMIEELQERLGRVVDHIASMQLLAEWNSHDVDHRSPDDRIALLDAERLQQTDDLHDFQHWWSSDRADHLRQDLVEHFGQSLLDRTSAG